MNKKAKGNNAQREFAKYLNNIGYETEIVRNTRQSHADFFGVGDILGIQTFWLVVQVKSNKSGNAIKKMRERKFPNNTIKWVAVRHDGAGGKPVRWRVIAVLPEKGFDKVWEFHGDITVNRQYPWDWR